LLTEKELKGVIAHEMAHIKNRDILIGSVAATIAASISFVAMMARWGALFGGVGGDRDGHNVVELLVLSILAPLIAMVIQLAISRSREYLADESGARILKDSKGLASALKKLEEGAKRKPMRLGNRNTAHMFIVNPFRKSNIMKLFSTHPSVDNRVKKLGALTF
jgi:heat shock protein HtpX